jgi:uncharacterized protein (TIGR03086 family)
MTTILDLGPAARRVTALLDGIDDRQLTARTPCELYTVGDLLDHMMGLTIAFRDAADKRTGPTTSAPPAPSAANLDTDWRHRLPEQLDELAAAWRNPAAWEGDTQAGGVTMPAAVMATVALDELVLHGWDLARATGQPYECDAASTEAVFGFTSLMSEPEHQAGREGLFGPVVRVPTDAPLFDRALAFSGRDPAWTPKHGRPAASERRSRSM